MKNLSILFIAFLLFQFTALAQDGWFWQNPLPQGNSLNDVWALDENHFIAIGDCGVFLNSSDGGENWTHQNIGMNSNLESIYFINQSTGWITGELSLGRTSFNEIILKTTNGGENWIEQDSIGGIEVFFIDENTGWIASGNWDIFNTIDGGTNWYLQRSGSLDCPLNSIFFSSPNRGWAVGHIQCIFCQPGAVLRTTNGGSFWTTEDGVGRSVFFVDDSTGWITHIRGGIRKTTDGGESWSLQNSGVVTNLESIFFLDDNYGWIVGGQYIHSNNVGPKYTLILKTTNSGDNWITQFDDLGRPLNSVHFVNQNTGIAIGEAGIIMKTMDGGDNWTSLTTGNVSNAMSHLRSVHFSDIDNGWAVGYVRPLLVIDIYPIAFKTTNGGEEWIKQDSVGGRAVFFVDNNTGWIAGDETILKTTNAGEDWIEQSTLGGESVFFVDDNTGWITDDNMIIKTTNGGEDWIEQSNIGGNSIFFIDSNNGWVVGNGGTVLKTTNGGTNWSSQTGVSVHQLNSVYFVNQDKGWIVGTMNNHPSGDGILLRTIDGGMNWSYIYTEPELLSIHFPNENTGWAIGSEGTIMGTVDGGANWDYQFSGTDYDLISVYFEDKDVGWLVGKESTILKTTNGGITFVEEEQIAEVPTVYKLTNNYPNPFNPSTKIRYSVSQLSNVVIKVFDILGNEIETLTDEYKPTGTYEITWYAENLPSGIYFYRLQAGDFVETKKMVLVK